jgi:hypothetical protein
MYKRNKLTCRTVAKAVDFYLQDIDKDVISLTAYNYSSDVCDEYTHLELNFVKLSDISWMCNVTEELLFCSAKENNYI